MNAADAYLDACRHDDVSLLPSGLPELDTFILWNPRHTGRDDLTPLGCAVVEDAYTVAEHLLEQKADIEKGV
eukprot:CAMPEP_0206206456 /NCGR_PEP_ID=MMETSP0166-20121206/14942_1 /ASSEMBLY_ACC=CAM_ASM_000260 /TAXON_ID=95228 /ORGANISM="Vannella robusta, Strain DIVA3 518/3/11/1/6" /LENGTH=71 /DNA_ID=CAMNT_0053626901 /DNA_START=63 /DNA_END=278 /DNA_ORIENTATION=+